MTRSYFSDLGSRSPQPRQPQVMLCGHKHITVRARHLGVWATELAGAPSTASRATLGGPSSCALRRQVHRKTRDTRPREFGGHRPDCLSQNRPARPPHAAQVRGMAQRACVACSTQRCPRSWPSVRWAAISFRKSLISSSS